ncbi:MAG: Flp pilus assembly protein CpaB [Bacillota bacterium]|nr:Flp pilus assembly protein CpaB [Bacillota bacterium]
MKSKFILIGAILFAVATTILFSKYIKSLDNKYKNDKSLVQVAVLKQDIKKDQKVTADMLEIKSYSSNSVLPGAIKNIKDIDGNYALVDMKTGEQLFEDRFTNQAKEKDVLTRKIKEGNRAISIAVSYVQSVSTIIEPEDYVDVISSVKNSSGASTTTTLLQNIRVLAVGEKLTKLSTAASASNTAQGTASGSQAKYTSITLELNPKQAEQITNAEANGDLVFDLRSSLEQK